MMRSLSLTSLGMALAITSGTAEARWLSVDPVKAEPDLVQNFNRYKYANSNPYSFTDPDGRRDIYIGGGWDKKSFIGGSQIVQSYAEGQKRLHPDRDIRYFSWIEVDNISAAMSKPLAEGEPLNVIGHSLGGSQAIRHVNDSNAKVTNLITIDPVGEQAGNGAKPSNTRNWVNVTASPATTDSSDSVAKAGHVLFGTTNTSGATTSLTSTAHHGYFNTMIGEVKAQETIDNSYKKPNE